MADGGVAPVHRHLGDESRLERDHLAPLNFDA
jgi:hypothetical protein